MLFYLFFIFLFIKMKENNSKPLLKHFSDYAITDLLCSIKQLNVNTYELFQIKLNMYNCI